MGNPSSGQSELRESPFSWILRLFPLFISATLLYLILSSFSGYGLLKEINILPFVLAVILALSINFFLGAFKWKRVLALSDIRLKYVETLRIWLGLYPITFIMPFQTGHVLYALAIKEAKNLGYLEAFESVAYDKYLNLVATFALIFIGQFLISEGHPLNLWWIKAGSGCVVLFYLLDELVIGWFSRFEVIQKRSRLIYKKTSILNKISLLAMAIFYQSTDVISMYMACLCLGVHLPFTTIIGIFPLILLLSYIPVTFSGFGAREGLIVIWLGGGLMTHNQSIASGLLVDFFEYIAPAVVGLVCVRYVAGLLAGGTGSLIKTMKRVSLPVISKK